jgi:integrase/recombinase XerD
MDPVEQARLDTLLVAMTQAMKLHGLRIKTIDSYRRTLFRVAGHFGRLD